MTFFVVIFAILGMMGLARFLGFTLGAALAALRIPFFLLGGVAIDLWRWVRRR